MTDEKPLVILVVGMPSGRQSWVYLQSLQDHVEDRGMIVDYAFDAVPWGGVSFDFEAGFDEVRQIEKEAFRRLCEDMAPAKQKFSKVVARNTQPWYRAEARKRY